MNYWEQIDWEYELQRRLQAAIWATEAEDRQSKCLLVGQCLLLMQEHLPQKAYHNIIKETKSARLLKVCFKGYLEYIGRMVEANPQVQQEENEQHHPNCRCEMPLPLDEQEDKRA